MLICPRCGKTSEQKEFIEAFCTDCYEFNIRLPKGLKVEVCGRCGRMKLHGDWQKLSRAKISEYVADKCRGEFKAAEPDLDLGICRFTFEKSGKTVVIERALEVEKVVTTCPDCSKSSGGYFEAIVQLRGGHERVERVAEKLHRILSKKTFVPKVEDMHGGLDIYVGSSKSTSEALQELGFKPVISRKLFGRKDGKKLYRVSYAIRV